jgi:MoaA/NifB/PqqE/SkfB family radical SAM enzyme
MNIDDINKIELEITSNCNAACPGCARTQNPDILEINSFGVEDLKRLFPTPRHIKDKKFKFCGVLGDPAFNPECLPMVEYLTLHGGYCQLSTNGGVQTADWWKQLGAVSNRTRKVDVVFCVDGHRETNHIYRVNTVFDVIDRNMSAYATAGGEATWMFIVFDHNEYELPAAEAHAKSLGFKFATRTGMRNSIHDWVAVVRKKDGVSKRVVKEEVVITTTGEKEHSKKEQVKELQNFIETYKEPEIPVLENEETWSQRVIDEEAKKTEILDSIICKLVHEGEIFIAADQTMWPCCFLWDSAFKNKDNIIEKLSEYKGEWNSLKTNSIDDVLQHEWFDRIIAESWDPLHNKHLARCIRTCGYKKAYQNEIKFTK